MRLTPSWFRSSSDTPSEQSVEDGGTGSGVTIYHTSENTIFDGDATTGNRVDTFVPDSDASLLAEIDELQSPVTVDEVTDQLIEPARPSIETWAAVHERLHQERLPPLDTAGEIAFDEAQGIVERTSHSNENNLSTVALLGGISIGAILALIALASMPLLTAVVVTLVTTAFAVWFVPW